MGKRTSYSQEEFFEQQDQIPVEISPPEPELVPWTDFLGVSQIHPGLADNISAAGYQQPTPVQKWGIPLILLGKDVMACAQTGSGKTAFYLLPSINRLLCQRGRRQKPGAGEVSPPVLILAPTRELCVQIFEEAQKFTQGSEVWPAVVYGGTEYKESLRQLASGVGIVVATPGRLHDLCERKHLLLRAVQTFVLDEADRMLDMGFEPQIRQIVQRLGMPKSRQTVMTSATFPPEVQHLAQDFMRSHSFMAVGRVGGTTNTITQKLEWVEEGDKENFLYGLLLHQQALGLILVFVNTKQQAVELEKFVRNSGFTVQSIHGDRSQPEREEALDEFKSARAPILIATDVAARGLDIPDVALVVQYDMAQSADDYVHRIGRTGRIGKRGISVGLMSNRNKGIAADLLAVFEDSGKRPPAFLVGMAISSGTYSQAGANGGQPSPYGGTDVRTSSRRGFMSPEERAKALRYTGFAKDAYGQGDEQKAKEVAQTIGPSMPGAYHGAAPSKSKGRGGKDKDKGANGRPGPYSRGAEKGGVKWGGKGTRKGDNAS